MPPEESSGAPNGIGVLTVRFHSGLIREVSGGQHTWLRILLCPTGCLQVNNEDLRSHSCGFQTHRLSFRSKIRIDAKTVRLPAETPYVSTPFAQHDTAFSGEARACWRNQDAIYSLSSARDAQLDRDSTLRSGFVCALRPFGHLRSCGGLGFVVTVNFHLDGSLK